ncbi:MAG: shikimate dehydrogenase [Mesorhizobium sp.]|nr:MAG: shikimate dehydrogenase [Mesorhizobium sp.]
MRGTGKADVFVMLAHPVGHAKSPGMFNEIFEQKGLDSLMVPLSCRPEDFDTFWAGITAAENIRGVIISVPYKVPVYHKCAAAHDRAARVQSANSVRRQADGTWYADNFDGVGFIDGLKAGGHQIADQRCKLRGAIPVEVGQPDPSGMDMAINATPSGLKASDPLPLDVSRLTPEMTVVDIIMEPAETALLKAAKEIGCRIQPGRPMMDFQVEAMAEFFDIERKDRHHG